MKIIVGIWGFIHHIFCIQSSGGSECFGFTFREQSCHPSLYTLCGWIWTKILCLQFLVLDAVQPVFLIKSELICYLNFWVMHSAAEDSQLIHLLINIHINDIKMLKLHSVVSVLGEFNSTRSHFSKHWSVGHWSEGGQSDLNSTTFFPQNKSSEPFDT